MCGFAQTSVRAGEIEVLTLLEIPFDDPAVQDLRDDIRRFDHQGPLDFC